MTDQTNNIKIATPPSEPQVEHEMVPETEECAICCDEFNKSTKKKLNVNIVITLLVRLASVSILPQQLKTLIA